MPTLIRSGLIDEVRFKEMSGATMSTTETDMENIPANKNDPSNWNNFTVGIIIEQVGAGTTFDLSDDTLDMAKGYAKNCKQRHSIEIQMYDANAYLMLNQAMRYNVDTAVQIKWSDGTQSTYGNVRFTVIPLLNPLPNLLKVHAHPSGTVGADPPTGYTDLGNVFTDEGANLTANQQTDAAGLPLYTSASVEHVFQIDFAEWDTGGNEGGGGALEPGVEHTVALELTDNTYIRYDGVFTELRRLNAVGADNLRTSQLRIVNGNADLANLLTLPGQGALGGTGYPGTYASGSSGTAPTVADCILGLQFSGQASGADESNFYIETNP